MHQLAAGAIGIALPEVLEQRGALDAALQRFA